METVFYYTYPSVGFLKQKFITEEGEVSLTIKPKLRFNPVSNFLQGSTLLYQGTVRKLSLTRFKLEIQDGQGKLIATIQQLPLGKKQSIFNEYSIDIGEESYYASYKIAARSVSIKDAANNDILLGTLESSLLKKVFDYKKYRFKLHTSQIPAELGMVLAAGIIILD